MSIQVLPNWFKKVGLSVFLIFSLPTAIDGFIDGLSGLPEGDENMPHVISSYFGDTLMHLFNVLTIVGMIIYMLSREKIEDDYISKLRLDSFQLAILIFLITSILTYAFIRDFELSLDYFINIFILLYLIIFFIKKRIY
jgi:hypothetical protein